MSIVPMILFINSEVNDQEIKKLQTQLFIDETITKAEFDARMVADPNYATIIHLRELRVMVILPTFQDLVNRQLADVVLYLHQGLADVEKNNFGPPCQNFPIDRLTIYEILRANNSPYVITLSSQFMPRCGDCQSHFFCDTCHTFSGIKICNGCQCSCKCFCDIHLPNCDNESNNIDFINRK